MIKKILTTFLFFTSLAAFSQRNITFGVISDVHQDLQKDAVRRLEKFLGEAKLKSPTFVIQLGDLSHSVGADTILKAWNRHPGIKYSVFGNHDMDHATKSTMLAKYSMPAGNYCFEHKGIRFFVLDCCYTRKNGKFVSYDNGNYFVKAEDRDLINPEQLIWLEREINSSNKPCVIFSHQALDEIGGSVPNRADFRAVIKRVNTPHKKVIAVICGHHHIDAYSEIDDVGYFQINSASYLWVDGVKKYSNGNMAEYRDPLYAFITINQDLRTIRVSGIESVFLPPAPISGDFPEGRWNYIKPCISNREVRY